MANRIHELRKDRGWSFEEVAKRVGPNTSASTIKKLEAGSMQLTATWMERLGLAFGVTPFEIIAAPAKIPAGFRSPGQMAEDVEPYTPAPGAHLPIADGGKGEARYVVTSHALDELGLVPGDVVTVSERTREVTELTTGDIVIAHVRLPGHRHETVVMREFIEPAILITNSRDHNETPINTRAIPTRVTGVVETVHRALRKPR